jgi:hypothetical protein
MVEDSLVDIAETLGLEILQPPLAIRRASALFYQITIDNQLKVRVDPAEPRRGQSACQTDLCVFERLPESVEIPRVVLEFKARLTTHDVLTYAAKARRHKQVYPYLRYGLVVASMGTVPGKFFTHNEGALDFCLAARGYLDDLSTLRVCLGDLLRSEIAASRALEEVAFGQSNNDLFRTDVVRSIRGLALHSG